jgi:hypothetical protein
LAWFGQNRNTGVHVAHSDGCHRKRVNVLIISVLIVIRTIRGLAEADKTWFIELKNTAQKIPVKFLIKAGPIADYSLYFKQQWASNRTDNIWIRDFLGLFSSCNKETRDFGLARLSQ